MTLNLSFEDLKRIALDGRVVKNGITLIVGRPLIPDVKTDTSGKLGEVRFTVDDRQVQPHGRRLVKPAAGTSQADS
ncbi:hypothetical protein [Granulicella tundricola]|uniref:Uncharacterized protein n=1 Tax=Granulicella tundricola (strain ATCC BAA-1859 / DSM 23138 / MP5ACTX9) TaxID=1198114 RepID=E8X7Z2_GRATM|nr:hypothetical protein [Granulicella tundricola]ADW71576.1 hypothetical protein AciX9_4646 [Granulicella tundricola MP5ACTX9]